MVGMAQLFTPDHITASLAGLDGWQHASDTLLRTAELGSFRQAIAVIDQVADIAEHDNHHPDIDIRGRTLTFRCTTHSAGGITELDVRLAHAINRVLQAFADKA